MKTRRWIWDRLRMGFRGLGWALGAGPKGRADRKDAQNNAKSAEEILFQMKFGKR